MARDHRQALAVVAGPLAGHAPGFAAHLAGLGYTDGAIHQHLLLLAEVSRWLQQQRLDTGQLPPAADRFATEIGRRRGRLVSARALGPLLGYLRDRGVVSGVRPSGPGTGDQATLAAQYRDYLRDVCGLSDTTARCYGIYVAGFLALLGERLDDVSGAQVLAAVSRQAGRHPAASMRAVVNADRALLRYLHRSGRIPRPLDAAVPSAARRPAGLPTPLDAATAGALLDSCDRRRETGSRDYAVLMLLKRYGVRPVEVCRLELTDMRWRSGELVVRGKGGRADALPLLHDIGEAVASYLQIRRTPPRGRKTGVAGVRGRSRTSRRPSHASRPARGPREPPRTSPARAAPHEPRTRPARAAGERTNLGDGRYARDRAWRLDSYETVSGVAPPRRHWLNAAKIATQMHVTSLVPA